MWKKRILFCLFALSLFVTAQSENQIFLQESDHLVSQNEINEISNMDRPIQEIVAPDFKASFFKMILVLIAFIVLLFITFWSLKRLRNRTLHTGTTKGIQILEKKVLSPKSILYLVEVENEKVLISESHLEVRALHSIKKEKEVEKTK